ncbi:MAG: hypothetical protein ABJJ26_03760, partial [Algoriphagus sp.]
QGQRSLLQFPSHFEETNRIFDAVKKMSKERSGRRVSSDQLEDLRSRRMLAFLRFVVRDSEMTLEDFSKTIGQLLKTGLSHIQYGPNKQELEASRIDLIEQLYGDRCSLPNLEDRSSSTSLEFKTLDTQERIVTDFLDFHFQEVLGFERGGVKYSSNDARVRARETDVSALTMLAILNRRTISAGVSKRFVFVTHDRALVFRLYRSHLSINRNIQKFFWSLLSKGHSRIQVEEQRRTILEFFDLEDEDRASSNRKNWFRKFSLHYIRHISSYSKDCLIESENTGELIDLFHGLFASSAMKTRVTRHRVEEIATNLRSANEIKISRAKYIETIGSWEALTQKSIEENLLESTIGRKGVEFLFQRFGKGNSNADTVAQLETLLKEATDRQRDRTMIVLSDIGARSLIASKEFAQRNPPDLAFETMPNVDSIFQSLVLEKRYDSKGDEFIEDFTTKTAQDCHPGDDGDDRQLSHVRFLVLAAAFASAQKWATALGHAERAIEIIRRSKNDPIEVKDGSGSYMTGREAYYLAATCARMTARAPEEFEIASDFLALSDDAYDKDMKKRPELGGFLKPIRSRSEKLALSLALYYFERSTREEESCSAFNVTKIVQAAQALITEIASYPELKFSVASSKRFRAPLTDQSVCVNLIQAFTVGEFRRQNGCFDISWSDLGSEDMLRRCIDRLYEISVSGECRETILVRRYKNVACLLVGDIDRCDWKSETDIVDEFGLNSDGTVTAYDKWRYEALKAFALNVFQRLHAQ